MALLVLLDVSVKDTVKFPEVAEMVFPKSIFGGKSGVVNTDKFLETGLELPNGLVAITYIVYVFAVNPVFTYVTMLP
jgi:hypothetical protein